MALFQKTSKPRLACEVTSTNVIAARANNERNGVDVYTVRRLPANAIVPSLTGNNVNNTSALGEAIGATLSTLSGRTRDVIAVIPDAAVRVMLLDFDALPERYSEAAPLVRFRLRKSLPFDVDSAALSFQVRRHNGGVKVLAAVTPSEVLRGYETAFRDAGYEPGIVLASSLAALSLVEAKTPTLLVKADNPFITMVIVDANEVLLYRTLDAPASNVDVADAIYPSIVFYEDTYAAKLQRILLAGSADLRQIASALLAQTEIRPEEVDLGGPIGESLSGESLSRSSIAGVAGVLIH